MGVSDGRPPLGRHPSVLFVGLDGPRMRPVQVRIGGVAPGLGAV